MLFLFFVRIPTAGGQVITPFQSGMAAMYDTQQFTDCENLTTTFHSIGDILLQAFTVREVKEMSTLPFGPKKNAWKSHRRCSNPRAISNAKSSK